MSEAADGNLLGIEARGREATGALIGGVAPAGSGRDSGSRFVSAWDRSRRERRWAMFSTGSLRLFGRSGVSRRVTGLVAVAVVVSCGSFAPASLAFTSGKVGDVYWDSSSNVGAGDQVLQAGGGMGFNVAFGGNALDSLTTGEDNLAFGDYVLQNATTAGADNAFGNSALVSVTTGDDNDAFGYEALESATTGAANAAFGDQALFSATTGYEDDAFGDEALLYATTGSNNTATGFAALEDASTGSNNAATGSGALSSVTTGSGNAAFGNNAGINLTTGSNDLDLLNEGVAGESNTIRIGTTGTQTAAFLAAVNGTSIAGPAQMVLVNSQGQLGTTSSDLTPLPYAVLPTDLLSQLSDFASADTAQQSQINTLETDNSNLTSELSSVQNTNTTQQSQINTLKTDNTNQRKTNTAEQKELNKLAAEIAKLTKKH
jgi:hypothetical protein